MSRNINLVRLQKLIEQDLRRYFFPQNEQAEEQNKLSEETKAKHKKCSKTPINRGKGHKLHIEK